MERMLIIGSRFGRTVDDQRIELGQTRIGKGFQDDFPPDAVGIALRDTYLQSVFRHKFPDFKLQRYEKFVYIATCERYFLFLKNTPENLVI